MSKYNLAKTSIKHTVYICLILLATGCDFTKNKLNLPYIKGEPVEVASKEHLINKTLLVTYESLTKKNSQFIYGDLKIYNKNTNELIQEFKQPHIWEVEGVLGQDSFLVKFIDKLYSLNIKYFIEGANIKWTAICKFHPQKDKLSIDVVLKKYDQGVDPEAITGLMTTLVLQGDKKAYEYVFEPTESQKKYHKFNDGAAAYTYITKPAQLLKKYGCEWL